jgi:hypothetical protein
LGCAAITMRLGEAADFLSSFQLGSYIRGIAAPLLSQCLDAGHFPLSIIQSTQHPVSQQRFIGVCTSGNALLDQTPSYSAFLLLLLAVFLLTSQLLKHICL